MKGIVLAGGSGTRLYPITKVISKQLLPVYDKPMIYYSLSTLMLSGIRDILIISTKEDLPNYKRLLGDGAQFGIKIVYEIQENPNGLAEAFIIGESFIGNDNVALILGDNIFYGQNFEKNLQVATERTEGATIFGYRVHDPERFGVVNFDKNRKPVEIIEKPKNPESNYAVTGLYYYDNKVVHYAKSIKPSKRGELEITDINRTYLEKNELNVELLGRGFAWLDMGTHESLIQAGQFIQTIESRQGLKIACLEEIAYQKEWISEKSLIDIAMGYKNNTYGKYLLNLIDRNESP